MDNKKAEDGAGELEYLKDDIKRLQVVVKELSFGEMMENSELERLRKEVFNLENLLNAFSNSILNFSKSVSLIFDNF